MNPEHIGRLLEYEKVRYWWKARFWIEILHTEMLI